MFEGNKSLRKAGEKINYTQDMVNEIVKCKSDIIYFAEKYYTIVTIDGGKQNIALWNWQKKVLKAYMNPPNNKKNIILKIARQSGKCVYIDSIVRIRNKRNDEIKEIKIGDFYKIPNHKKIKPIDNKFIESFEVEEWEVETNSGWKDITHIHKTIKFDIWEVITEKCSLKCADDHIVMINDFKQKFVKDLIVGVDKVITKNGLEKVTLVQKLDIEPQEMYDITVKSDTHTLYTNNILSHNTTITTIFLLWYVLFNKDKTAAIMANKEALSIEILDRIKIALKFIPVWLQQGIVDWNKKSVVLENGSRIIAAATSSQSLTGFTINLLYLDEFAKVPQHIADDFIASTYPVITSGKTSMIIMVSTPFGMNHFYKFWMDATRKDSNTNSFYPISVGWWEVPGRDENFKKAVIKDIGRVKWQQEYGTQFLGSSSTLIDPDILERIVYKNPVATKWTGLLLIYEQPQNGITYVLGVDSGKGTGRDYSVIQVLKIINEYNIEQVALYRNNFVRPHDFSQVVVSIAQFFNNAYIMIENNDIGQSVCDNVWYELEYENLVNVDMKGLGIRSTKSSKRNANALLKEYVEKHWLNICDERTVYELSRYEEVKPNVFAAGKHEHDDCFKEDTLIKTKRGYVSIKEVKIGDEVLTHKGRWKKVTNLIKKQFNGDWYDIKFKGLLNLSTSYNHPIYTDERSWVIAQDWKTQSCISVKMPLEKNKNKVLKFDDYVEVKKMGYNINKFDLVMDFNFAKFLGLFLAEGCCDRVKSHHYTMSMAFHIKEVYLINEMSEYLKTIGIKSHIYYPKGKKGCCLTFSSKFLYTVLSKCYDKNRFKVLPEYAFDLGEDLKYVLEYWLKGDGWHSNVKNKNDHTIGASISKKLALDMRDIAISLGKKANIQKVTKRKKGEKDQYHVTVYNDYNKNCNSHSVIPISNFETLHKLSYKKEKPLIQKSHFEGTVYNISVEEDESFVCEGIVVHNCVTSLLWSLFFIKTEEYDSGNEGNKTITDEYNVDKGNWDEKDVEVKDDKKDIDGSDGKGDPNWQPSAIFV